jgi:hypothetical protein
MSSQRQQGRNDANKHHKNRALHSVTSGISSGSAGASGSESRSASIRGLGLVSPLLSKSSAYTDDREEDDTDTSRSKPSHVWCANHALTPQSMGDKTTVKLVVTTQVFHKVKFVDRDTDLAFSEEKKSICQYVISHCNVHTDIIITDWWKQVRTYVSQAITRLRNDRNTAMKWAVLGNCDSMLYYVHRQTLYLT